jgi:preprotein translocase subunit YajC
MIRKLIGGVAAATLLSVFLATGALAAADAPSSTGSPSKHRPAYKDYFAGTVTAITESQLTVHHGKGTSKTFLRTDSTRVFVGKDPASWSDIKLNSHLAVRFEERSGKLYAKQVRIGRDRADRAYIRGIVETVAGNSVTVKARNGKETTITISASTKYFEGRSKHGRTAGSLQDIEAGQHLLALGKRDANGSFDAAVVIYWGGGAR